MELSCFHAVSTNPTLLLSLILINQFIIISKCQFTLTKSFCTFRWFSAETNTIWMLYRRQWLTCAFQSVISTGINIHVQEPDWSFYTNWSSPSLQPARVLGQHGRLWNQQHSEYPIINFYYGNVPLYPWPGYNTSRGKVVVPRRRTWRRVLKARWPKHDGRAKGARQRESVEFLICYQFQSQSEKQQCLSYVYWTIFCYTLIDLLACVPYYSMHVLNKHEGLSKKKKLLVTLRYFEVFPGTLRYFWVP